METKAIYEAMFNGLQGRKYREVKKALWALRFDRFQNPDQTEEGTEAVFNLDENLDLCLEWNAESGRIERVTVDEIIPR